MGGKGPCCAGDPAVAAAANRARSLRSPEVVSNALMLNSVLLTAPPWACGQAQMQPAHMPTGLDDDDRF